MQSHERAAAVIGGWHDHPAMVERCTDDDVDDLRRRCAAHGQWMTSHPEAVALAASWADQAFELISDAADGRAGHVFNTSR